MKIANENMVIPSRYLRTKSNREIWKLEREIQSLILKVVKERKEATSEKDLLEMILRGSKSSSELGRGDTIDRFVVTTARTSTWQGTRRLLSQPRGRWCYWPWIQDGKPKYARRSCKCCVAANFPMLIQFGRWKRLVNSYLTWTIYDAYMEWVSWLEKRKENETLWPTNIFYRHCLVWNFSFMHKSLTQ